MIDEEQRPASSFDDCDDESNYQPFGENGFSILDEVRLFLERFVAYPSPEACNAHALWVVHAHLLDSFESTPRIAFLSPEPASGKTRALEATELLVPRAVEAINVSPAYLFRKVGAPEGRPTILFDEIDTVFGPKARDNEEIRGLLNAGHRRSGVAGRCVVRGKIVETEEIPAYCAVALAGLGWLPDTILSRSIIIRMRRRAPDETVEPFRRREAEPMGTGLKKRIAAWAAKNAKTIEDARPDMPVGIEDRNADVWEPLIAIADAAGGEWPQVARATAVTLVTLAREANLQSLGIQLLTDIRTIFDTTKAIGSKALTTALCNMDESPWGDLKGKPLNDRGLASRLKAYSVSPKLVRINGIPIRGYTKEDFWEAWRRYLPEALGSSPAEPLRPLHPSHRSEMAENRGEGVTVNGEGVTVEHPDPLQADPYPLRPGDHDPFECLKRSQPTRKDRL